MASEYGVDVPIHKQLDRIEALRVEQDLTTSPRERLRQMCEDLYGSDVPASWLDQALAPLSPPPASDAPTAVISLTSDTTAPADRSFRALVWWSQQRYERPGSREEWQARRAVLDRLHQKWKAVENLAIFLFIVVGMLGVPVGVLTSLAEFNSKGPVVIFATLVPVLLVSGICRLGNRLSHRLGLLRQLIRRLLATVDVTPQSGITARSCSDLNTRTTG